MSLVGVTWKFIVVSFAFYLMRFMCLLTLNVFSLVEYQSFAHSSVRLFVLFSSNNSYHILDTSSLYLYTVCKYFLFVTCLFPFLLAFETNFKILMKPNWSIFFSYESCFGFIVKNCLPSLRSNCDPFWVLIHFEWIFVYVLM